MNNIFFYKEVFNFERSMTRFIFSLLFLFCFFSSNSETYTFNILGYQYEDSIGNSTQNLYQKVLNQSSYFSHQVGIEKGNAIKRNAKNKTSVFFISIFLLYVFAGIRHIFSHQFEGSFNILKNFNQRSAQTEINDVSMLSFYALYLLSLGYILYRISFDFYHLFQKTIPILAIVYSIGIVLFLFIIKYIFFKIFAWTFNLTTTLKQYFLNVALVYKLSAIVLFPLSILLIISTNKASIFLLKIAIFVFVIGILIRTIRNAGLIKYQLSKNFLHFILYLCTFEIIPLLLLFKYIN